MRGWPSSSPTSSGWRAGASRPLPSGRTRPGESERPACRWRARCACEPCPPSAPCGAGCGTSAASRKPWGRGAYPRPFDCQRVRRRVLLDVGQFSEYLFHVTVAAAQRRGRPPAAAVEERIIEAALGLFAERGYHGTTIPAVL